MRWRTGVSSATASKVVAVAERASEFPHCVATMQRGELSLDQMVPIVKYAPGWCDQQMSGLAPRLSVAQVAKTAREYPWDYDLSPSAVAESDGSSVEDDVVMEAADSPTKAPVDVAWFGWDDNGRFRLHADLGADSGSIIDRRSLKPETSSSTLVHPMSTRSTRSSNSPNVRSTASSHPNDAVVTASTSTRTMRVT